MLSALRFAYEKLSADGSPLPESQLVFKQVDELPGVKEAAIMIPAKDGNHITLNIAIVLGLADAKKYVKAMKEGRVKHHFVEVMGCVPGGCISGGGQPPVGKNKELIDERRAAINVIDEHTEHKAAHHNPYIERLYKDYIGEPCGETAHDLLHIHEDHES